MLFYVEIFFEEMKKMIFWHRNKNFFKVRLVTVHKGHFYIVQKNSFYDNFFNSHI